MNTLKLVKPFSVVLVVAVAGALAGCPKTGGGKASTSVSDIKPGMYSICGEKKIGQHQNESGETLTEDHLAGATKVKIEASEPGTLVSFLDDGGQLVFAVFAAPHDHGLSGMGSFLHETPGHEHVNMVHKVKIAQKKDKTPQGCSGQNVLAIKFCNPFTDEGGNTGYQCPENSEEPHLGDVHAQN
jgi:hypothetical protein